MRRFFGYTFLALYTLVVIWFVVAEFVPQLMPDRIVGSVSDWRAERAERRRASMMSDCRPEEPAVRSAHLLFVGDVMAHLPQVESATTGRERFDFYSQLRGVEALFAEADYVVGNLETTLSPREPYSGYPSFATPVELATAMKRVGFDAVTIANNHVVDRGSVGVLSTIAGLDSAHIEHLGAEVPSYNQGRTEPLVRDVGGFKVALMAYTYGVNGSIPEDVEVGVIDTAVMRRHISMVRAEVEYIFVLLHWGAEYQRRPNGEQLWLAEWLREAGVDFIFGSHPHVVQPYEVWRDEAGHLQGGVFYSLGNFISNQNDRHTDYGLAAHVHLVGRRGEPTEMIIRADTVRRLRYTEGGRVRYGVSVD